MTVDEAEFDWSGAIGYIGIVVDEVIDCLGTDATTGCNAVSHLGPDAIDHTLGLLAILGAHAVAEIGFDGALELTVFDDFESDAEFIG